MGPPLAVGKASTLPGAYHVSRDPQAGRGVESEEGARAGGTGTDWDPHTLALSDWF